MTQRVARLVLLSLAFGVALAEADGLRRPTQGEFRVNSYAPGNQFGPKVAARPNGGFVVVWTSDQEFGTDAHYAGYGAWGIFARLYNSSGHPVGREFLVNDYTTGAQLRPSVAVAPSGEFVVAWTGYGDGGQTPPGGRSLYGAYGVFARQFAGDGTPLGGDFQVNTYTTNYQGAPAIAMSRSGDFVVVWQSSNVSDTAPQDGSGVGVFGRQFAASGVPLGDEFQVNTYTPGSQSNPAVAAAASGDFTVAWQSFDGSSVGIFGQRFEADGSPRGNEFRVNSYTPGSQGEPTIGASRDGDFVVAWTGQGVPPGQDGSASGIFAQRFNRLGQRRGRELLVNTYTTGSQTTPCLSSTADGDFVVVWTSAGQDGSGSGVFGRAFGADGARRGPEFQVNTYTTGFQSNGCVAALPSGDDFVVTWESYLQDGSASGVFGRRFEKPPYRH